ncbi:unnamed protein product, partial [Prorocentrum cordatum]
VFIDFLLNRVKAATPTAKKPDLEKAKKVIKDARKCNDELGDYQTDPSPSMEGMRKACTSMKGVFASGRQLKILDN